MKPAAFRAVQGSGFRGATVNIRATKGSFRLGAGGFRGLALRTRKWKLAQWRIKWTRTWQFEWKLGIRRGVMRTTSCLSILG